MSTIDTIGFRGGDSAIVARPIARRRGRALLRGVIQSFIAWIEKRRSRAVLQTLTDDQLRDIGITRRDAEREISKSFFWY